MVKSIVSQLVNHSIGLPKKLSKPVNYILCGTGAKEIRETELGTFIVTPKEIVGLEKVPEGFKIKIKETGYESYRIDTPEDLINLEKVLCYDKR